MSKGVRIMWLTVFVILFCVLILFPIVAFIIYRINKGKGLLTVTPNAPLIDCTVMTQFTDGYCFGRRKRERRAKNGCILFEMYPYDAEEGEDQPRPEVQSFVAHKNMVKRIPKGSASSRREKIIILSRDPTDIPIEIRDTEQGRGLSTAGQLAFLIQTFGRAIPSGDEAIFEAMKEYSRGQISSYTMQKMKEETEAIRTNLAKEEEKKHE